MRFSRFSELSLLPFALLLMGFMDTIVSPRFQLEELDFCYPEWFASQQSGAKDVTDAFLAECVDAWYRVRSDNDLDRAIALNFIAEEHMGLRQYSPAILYYEKLLIEEFSILAAYPAMDTIFADIRWNLTQAYMALGQPCDAAEILLKLSETPTKEYQFLTTQTDRILAAIEVCGRGDETNEVKPLQSALDNYAREKYRDYAPLVSFEPDYPDTFAKQKLSGSVTVEYTVTYLGIVTDARVVDSNLPALFHEEAIKAAARFKFAPRLEYGRPVTTPWVQTKFNFEQK